jgi:hypothetical protein
MMRPARHHPGHRRAMSGRREMARDSARVSTRRDMLQQSLGRARTRSRSRSRARARPHTSITSIAQPLSPTFSLPHSLSDDQIHPLSSTLSLPCIAYLRILGARIAQPQRRCSNPAAAATSTAAAAASPTAAATTLLASGHALQASTQPPFAPLAGAIKRRSSAPASESSSALRLRHPPASQPQRSVAVENTAASSASARPSEISPLRPPTRRPRRPFAGIRPRPAFRSCHQRRSSGLADDKFSPLFRIFRFPTF